MKTSTGIVIAAAVIGVIYLVRQRAKATPTAPTGKTTTNVAPPKVVAPGIAAPPVKPVIAAAHPQADLPTSMLAPTALHPIEQTATVGIKGVLI